MSEENKLPKETQSISPQQSKDEKIVELLHRTAIIISNDESTLYTPVDEEPRIHQENKTTGERFEILKLLGAGSMGQVYKGYDPTLQRHIALKFLQADNDLQTNQFLREARAQARVEHEHICKVYEVGELRGKQYIAMQYIDGKTLQAAAHEMVLEQKIKVLSQVAEAVHAAHEMGLIHRDVKPSNIMVEKTADGWKPYVMDFGLVREQAAPGVTRTGAVIGSPSYMAPEQALGDPEKLDRRSDVYSLGATLYELLSGHPPYEGSNAAEVIVKVLQEEPQPLRKHNQSIPRDLETISMKCLQKESYRRYDSAKALAEDLRRYLQAEPILAQRSNLYSRAIKKAKKHKVTTSLAAVAMIMFFLLTGLWLRTRWKAAEQTRLAQQFGQEVEKIEGFMRYAYTLPLHDVKREKKIVEDRMKWIENEMTKMGNSGVGPGNYALGRGYNALHQYDKAHDHLLRAWNSGYQIPEVAYGLGQVLGILYQKGLQDAERIGSKAAREARTKQLEMQYRQPALFYLNQSSGVKLESVAYIEALIAFYEKRYEDSLKKVRQATLQVPWLYEVQLLEGNAYMQMGSKQRKSGEYEKALANLTTAAEKFEQASSIARSDATIYESQCRLWNILQRVHIDTGQSAENAFAQMMSTCGNALAVNPDSADALETEANSMWLMGWHHMYAGKDPTKLFLKSIEFSKRAQNVNPQMVDAFVDTASAYRYLGDYTELHGGNPTEYYQKAIQSCEKALRINKNDYFSNENMAGIYRSLGNYVSGHGSSPQHYFQKAIRSYQIAQKINPGVSETHNNLGTVYSTLGEYVASHGENPTIFYENAVECQKKSIALNPNVPYSYANLGGLYINMAVYAMQQGKDPTRFLSQSLEIFQKGIKTNPKLYYMYESIGVAYFHLGEYAFLQWKDPKEFEKNAVANLEKALELNPEDMETILYLSNVYTQRAKFLITKKLSPLKAVNLGKSYIERAMKLNPSSADPYLRRGEIETLAAQWEIKTGIPPENSLRISRENLQRAIDINGDDPRAYLAMAKSFLVCAQWNSEMKKDVDEEIKFGLEMIDKFLSINPGYGEALAIRGSLYLIQAISGKDQNLRTGNVKTASDLLKKSLEINPLLRMEYQSNLDRVRSIP